MGSHLMVALAIRLHRRADIRNITTMAHRSHQLHLLTTLMPLPFVGTSLKA